MAKARKKVPPLVENPPSPLKAERLLKGWNRETVAGAVGISVASLDRYEAGTFQPSVGMAQALATLYGKSVEELWPVEAAA